MNTQIINAELQQALRKCLPFVRRHAIISGGDGSLTYAFAVRALADADARQREEVAVKNIAEAEAQRAGWRKLFEIYGVRADAINAAKAQIQAARAVQPEAKAFGPTRAERGEPGAYTPALPPAKGCDCDVCTRSRLAGSVFRNFNKGSQA